MNSPLPMTWIVLLATLFLGLLLRPIEADEPIQANDEEIGKLLIEKMEVARQLAKAADAKYQVGVASLEQVARANILLCDTELEVAKTKSERVKIHEQRVANLRSLERAVANQHDVGATGGSDADYYAAKTAYLAGQIDLLREKQADNPEAANNSENITSLLVEKRGVARELAKAALQEYANGTKPVSFALASVEEQYAAELELAKSQPARGKVVEQYATALQKLHQEVETMYNIGTAGGTATAYYSTKAAHLKGQIVLQRAKKTDDVGSLLVERKNAAQKLVESSRVEYQIGKQSLGNLSQANNVLLEAELELAKTKNERVKIHEQHVANLRRAEEESARKYRNGAGDGSAGSLSAKLARLNGEIALLREQGGE